MSPLAAGDLNYLEDADLLALKLPGLAHSVMTRCIQTGLCRPPIVLEFPDAAQHLQTSIKVCLLISAVDCNQTNTGSCAQQLYHLVV